MSKLILLLSLFLICIENYSQENSNWINYTSYDLVKSIVEDGDILWIGTDGGLLRLDRLTGDKFYYNKANSGLPDNNINSIILDSLGTLICATNKGLVKFKDEQWSIFSPSPSPDNLNPLFTYMTFDKKNNLLLGSAYDGLFKYDGTKWEHFYVSSEFDVYSPGVEVIAVDSSNTIWLGAKGNLALGGYLAMFDGIEITKIETVDSIHNILQVYSVAVDKTNKICVGYDGGYCEFDGKSWTNYSYSNILSVLVDENNLKWLTSFDGIYKFDNSFTHIDTPYPIFEDREIYSSILTANNSKIFGTSSGIVEYSDSSWNEYDLSFTKMKRNETFAIIGAENNKIWLGTIDGIIEKNNENWKLYKSNNSGLSDYWIYDLAVDHENNLWIGTFSKGITKFDGNSWSNYNENDFYFLKNGVKVIESDIDGSIWLGSWGNGLIKYDGTIFTNYTKENSQLPDNYIRSIAIDSNGAKWIGTDDGILKIDNDNWKVYNSTNSAISNHGIWSIIIDKNGNKYFGTANDGLYKLSGNEWTHYTETNSNLPDNTIYSLAVDSENSIWIGTRFGGIAKFSNNTFGEIFNEDNSPLPDNEIRDLFFDKDNNLWIATMNGVAVYKDLTVGVENKISLTPSMFSLSHNYPNPFNPTTTIDYTIPYLVKSETSPTSRQDAKVIIVVYDVLGKEIETLENTFRNPGKYKVLFNGTDNASGIYYYQLRINDFVETKKMILLK